LSLTTHHIRTACSWPLDWFSATPVYFFTDCPKLRIEVETDEKRPEQIS